MFFQMIVYLQSSIMPKGSPSPVHLCHSCLRRFGDLKKNTPVDFGDMYFVDFVVFCDFELSRGALGSKKHPGGTKEAPRKHPGGTQEARDILETECVFSCAPARKSNGGDHFRVDGSDVTVTVYRACTQELTVGGANIAVHQIPNTEDTPPEPLQQGLFGEQMHVDLICPIIEGLYILYPWQHEYRMPAL